VRLEQDFENRLKALCRWERDARLPALHRAQADAGPRSEVSLDQASPAAMAEEQAAK
jgi:hypothetical protein